MSIEAHPNIQAVELTVDILISIAKNVRGDGLSCHKQILQSDIIKNKLTDFVVDISCEIDEIVKKQKVVK